MLYYLYIIYYTMHLYTLASWTYYLTYIIIYNIYDYLIYDYILGNVFIYFNINGYYIFSVCYILYKYAIYVCVYLYKIKPHSKRNKKRELFSLKSIKSIGAKYLYLIFFKVGKILKVPSGRIAAVHTKSFLWKFGFIQRKEKGETPCALLLCEFSSRRMSEKLPDLWFVL